MLCQFWNPPMKVVEQKVVVARGRRSVRRRGKSYSMWNGSSKSWIHLEHMLKVLQICNFLLKVVNVMSQMLCPDLHRQITCTNLQILIGYYCNPLKAIQYTIFIHFHSTHSKIIERGRSHSFSFEIILVGCSLIVE